jgi:hypothetical protein
MKSFSSTTTIIAIPFLAHVALCFTPISVLNHQRRHAPTTRTGSSNTGGGLHVSTIHNNIMDAKDDDHFTVGVLGDLHMDPHHLSDYGTARDQWLPILKDDAPNDNVAVVSLGDLGESKAVDEDSDELFSGTTRCHEMAASYLQSFDVPYELVGGNHGTYTPAFVCLLPCCLFVCMHAVPHF